MAISMNDLYLGSLGELRRHPVRKWVRARLGEHTVVDTRNAQLVWEPKRIVPAYAVPEADLSGVLVPADPGPADERPVSMEEGPPVLDPSSPFGAHTTPGAVLTIRAGGAELPAAAFRPEDPDLAGFVILDWDAFSQWFEEAEPVTGHPHDPFKRIDCLRSTRRVEISHEGVLLADSARPFVLFETHLPPRFYLPREDVAMDLLETSETHTVCAYKGLASYWSARVGDSVLPDIAWSYPEPLLDAEPVRGRLCFFTERLDLTLDGLPQQRPRTPWS